MYNGRRSNWNDQKHSLKGYSSISNGWKRNTKKNYAPTSRGPKIACYYCGIVGHVKVD